MSGLTLFPNRIRPQALAIASAAALLFTGVLTADDKKPSRPAASAPSAPRATPSRPSAPAGGGGHSAPAGGGHSAPSAGGGRSMPSGGGHAGSGGGTHTGGMAGGGRPTGGASTGGGGGTHTGGMAGGGRPTGGSTGGGGTHTGGMAGSGRSMGGSGGGGGTHTGGMAGGGRSMGGSGGGGGTHTGGMAGGGRSGGAGRMGPSHGPASVAHNVRNTPSGHQVAMHNGRPSEIRSRDMMIRRGPSGMRRSVVERNGHVYSFNRAGYGHIRSGYQHGGRDYAVRRYYVGGAYYPRYYRSYGYRGVFFDAYAPASYYSPYYYGWAYRPWAAPVAFGWGWGGSPWYGYYGGYFTPYPTYPSANLWLTDYIVAQTLEASYRERAESARAAQQQFGDQPPPVQAAMTPEIKQQIAEEVQRQLKYEAAEASNRRPVEPGAPPAPQGETDYTGVGRMLEDNNNHVLLANANIDVTTGSGQECSISQGDAISIVPGQGGGQGDETAQVKVLSSAGGGCPRNSVVTVSLQDLQEMVNHIRATMDSGLAAMQKDPKLPKPPASVSVSTTPSEFVSGAPPADPNEAAELARLNQEATSTEQSVFKEASLPDGGAPVSQPSGSNPSTPSGQSTELQPGMTPEQVIQMKGNPTGNTKFGPKQILTYPGLKLTFTNGKLTDIQ